MLPTILVLASLVVVARAQNIPSVDNTVSYTCPDRSTIEAAYQNYCPSETDDGFGALVGVKANIVYNDAPDDYTTRTGSFSLECDYQPEGRLTCGYTAGGGLPLSADAGSDDICPDISQTVPQPSPGVDYRRRDLSRRAIVGSVPAFTCPFTSDDPDLATFVAEVRTGVLAVENDRGIAVQNGEVFYICQLTNDAECWYIQNNSGAVSWIGSSSTEGGICPGSLCAQVAPVTGNRFKRGLFMEGYQARIRQNQVDTRRLRTRRI